MPFLSFQFLIFICLTAVIYFCIPQKWKWGILLAASYVYFFINSEWLLLILFAETLVTFLTGILIEKQADADNKKLAALNETITKEEKRKMLAAGKNKRRLIMSCGICIVLFTLAFLKYYNFLAETVSFITRRFEFSFPSLNLLLPLGISFYTLQAIAYMADVYRGKIRADRNLLKFMLFMSYFPQIIQGPIPRYNQLAEQLYQPHSFEFQRFCYGFQLMIWGFMKKMIIADRIAIPVSRIFTDAADYEGLILFFAAAAYGIQIYADFSGGMDIARGFSQIIGIDLELNFTQPYFSISVEDFWRRWHITLGGFMRDYVFYPLSLSKTFTAIGKKTRRIFGNSVGKKIPAFLAMFIVYFLVGLWHGAQWKYVAYGIWNGLFIAGGILLSDMFLRIDRMLHINTELVSWKMFRIFRTFIIVSFGRFFVRADGLKSAVRMMGSFFRGWYDCAFVFDGTLNKLGIGTAEWILILIMILILAAVDYLHEKDVFIREWIRSQGVVFEMLIVIISVTAIFILGVYGPGYDAARFIYQQF